jgi:hypothetical protein
LAEIQRGPDGAATVEPKHRDGVDNPHARANLGGERGIWVTRSREKFSDAPSGTAGAAETQTELRNFTEQCLTADQSMVT